MPAVCVGSVGDGFEEFSGELLVVGVEVVDGFEDEVEVVGGLAFVFVEDERVCDGVERECDVAEDVEGGGLMCRLRSGGFGRRGRRRLRRGRLG